MISRENGFELPSPVKITDPGKYAFAFIALFVALLLIYSNSFQGEWHFDDSGNILENQRIQIKSLSLSEINKAIHNSDQNTLWRPLPSLSFAVNYMFGQKNVLGYHLINFAIHYLAAVFLFLLIFNTLKLPRLKAQYEDIAYPVALLATFFWALNPIHINCITYIVQRYTSMVGLFYIMAMYFYLKGRTSEKRSDSVSYFILFGIAGLAAVFSKENAAMLPVSILLFDLFLIRGVTKENVNKYILISLVPFVLILIIGFIYTSGFSNFFGFPDLMSGYKIRGFTLTERLLTESRVIIYYLTLLFYPIGSRLNFLYDLEISRSLFQPWTTFASILLIFSIIGFALYIARRRPLISFCIIFFFLNHIIEGTIFNLELVYDYRNYLPSIFLFIPVALFVIHAIDYFAYKKTIQIAIAICVAVLLFAEGDITYRRNKIVIDDALLWFDNMDKSPKLSRPFTSMGAFYFNHDEKEKAFEYFQKAIALNNWGGSNFSEAVQDSDLGIYYFTKMENDLAMKHLQKASLTLNNIREYIYMAKIELRRGKTRFVKQIIGNKLKDNPDKQELLELYGLILLKEGNVDDAMIIAKKCLLINPDYLNTLKIMAQCCRMKKNYPSAISYWKSVRMLDPQNAYANLALIELYKATGNKKMLNQEIVFLHYLQGSSTLREYIRKLNKDEKLQVYVPREQDFSFTVM